MMYSVPYLRRIDALRHRAPVPVPPLRLPDSLVFRQCRPACPRAHRSRPLALSQRGGRASPARGRSLPLYHAASFSCVRVCLAPRAHYPHPANTYICVCVAGGAAVTAVAAAVAAATAPPPACAPPALAGVQCLASAMPCTAARACFCLSCRTIAIPPCVVDWRPPFCPTFLFILRGAHIPTPSHALPPRARALRRPMAAARRPTSCTLTVHPSFPAFLLFLPPVHGSKHYA